MQIFDPYQPLFWHKVGLSVLCGGIIGLERQLRGKPAGIRTSILICLGTEIFVALGTVLHFGSAADPARVIGQVVTGIGFLGAGVIMSKEGLVVGVTSAAVIWVLAAIGSAIALGYDAAAVMFAVVTVCLLTGIEVLENTFHKLRVGSHARLLPFTRRGCHDEDDLRGPE